MPHVDHRGPEEPQQWIRSRIQFEVPVRKYQMRMFQSITFDHDDVGDMQQSGV